MFRFFVGLSVGVLLTILFGGHTGLSREQLSLYTFKTLQDDMSLDNDTKWLVFLHKRAEWKMCDVDEKYVEEKGVPRCVRTPIEFEPITKE